MSRPVDERLSAWLDGALDPAAAEEVERLVRDDPAWARRAAELRGLSAALREPAEDDAVPPGFHARARARFEEVSRPSRRFGMRHWRLVGAAAAALLLLALWLPASLDRYGDLRAPERQDAARRPAAPAPAPAPAETTGADAKETAPAAKSEGESPVGETDAQKRRDRSAADPDAVADAGATDRVAQKAAAEEAVAEEVAPPPAARLEARSRPRTLAAEAAGTVALAPGWPAAGATRIVRDRVELAALGPERAGAAFLDWVRGWDGASPLLLAGAPEGRELDCAAAPVEVAGALEFRARSRPARPGSRGAGCAIAPGPLDRPATIRIVPEEEAP